MRTITDFEMDAALKLIKAISVVEEELQGMKMSPYFGEDTKLALTIDTVTYGYIVPVEDWYEYQPKEFPND